MTRQLDLIDSFVATGRNEFTFEEAKELLGCSRGATSNALRGLTEKGLLDRVTHGHYAIRPLGSLGTSAVTDDLALAVGAASPTRPPCPGSDCSAIPFGRSWLRANSRLASPISATVL
jgi:predicted transcriptional regulator of viral defense system